MEHREEKRVGRGRGRLMAVCVLLSLGGTLGGTTVWGAEFEERTRQAYNAYAEQTRQFFMEHIATDGPRSTGEPARSPTLRAGGIVVGPGGEDGIIGVPGGLLHHWVGTVFIPGVRLDDVLRLSHSYTEYPAIYEPVVASQLLGREDDTFLVLLRLEERAAMLATVLDVWSTIRYVRVNGTRAYSMSNATEIREVADAAQPSERLLPAGEGRGYLWRANAFTKYVERDGGVYLELETLGLSRRFPRMLGWIIEPIARRIGRKSVEGSLEEFREALLGATADSSFSESRSPRR